MYKTHESEKSRRQNSISLANWTLSVGSSLPRNFLGHEESAQKTGQNWGQSIFMRPNRAGPEIQKKTRKKSCWSPPFFVPKQGVGDANEVPICDAPTPLFSSPPLPPPKPKKGKLLTLEGGGWGVFKEGENFSLNRVVTPEKKGEKKLKTSRASWIPKQFGPAGAPTGAEGGHRQII